MSDYKYDNKLVTCPYDEAHRLKASRMQAHIAKCKLNHLDMQKEVCPFNATHLLDRGEFNYHLINCPDRGPLDRHMAQTLDQNNPYKGNTSVPTFSDPHVESEENWDEELVAPRIIPSRPPPGAIVEPPAMSKPSQRKLLYRNLHQMHNQTENDDPPPVRKPVPRQPNPVEVSPDKNSTDPKTIQNLGLGRGKNRLAANFNNNMSNGISEKSYSNIVKNMSNLGLGRGQSSTPVSVPRVYDDDDDEEYPVLGCGRGALIAPKKNPRTPGSKKPE